MRTNKSICTVYHLNLKVLNQFLNLDFHQRSNDIYNTLCLENLKVLISHNNLNFHKLLLCSRF